EKVRLAAFGSALGTLGAAAGKALRADRAATDVLMIQAEPADALRMLRVGEVDVALVFRYTRASAGSADGADGQRPATGQDAPGGGSGAIGAGLADDEDVRYHEVLDEPVYLITPAASAPPAATATDAVLAGYSGHRWVAGCERCKDVLIQLCRSAGFSPDIAVTTDDYVTAQALVATGLGAAILPGLALRALRHPGVAVTELPGTRRQVL